MRKKRKSIETPTNFSWDQSLFSLPRRVRFPYPSPPEQSWNSNASYYITQQQNCACASPINPIYIIITTFFSLSYECLRKSRSRRPHLLLLLLLLGVRSSSIPLLYCAAPLALPLVWIYSRAGWVWKFGTRTPHRLLFLCEHQTSSKALHNLAHFATGRDARVLFYFLCLRSPLTLFYCLGGTVGQGGFSEIIILVGIVDIF